MAIGKLHIVPLGGIGEFGMNCMAIRYGDDIVVVDAGLMFPEAELLGVDIVVPDISYLLENRKHVRGIILTHGHEDHIGALPWILSELNVPVWGTEFTLAYVEDKLDEHQLLDDSDLHEIRPGERFKVGPFTIHPLQVTHSLVDCVALAIHTPLGVVLHTGDFKVDPTPTDNRLFDLHGFAEYGKEGVLALLQDSTNVERKGYTPSERAVRRKFEEVFVRTKRRLFVSCFSSSIHRIKLTVDMAREHGRKICFIGRSMENSSEIAEDLGYVQIPEGMMIHPGEMKNFPPEKVCVLISGTQGEPMSALTRLSVRDHKQFKIVPGDTVVIAATPIPGNEKAVSKTINNLYRLGANVIHGSSGNAHVSGHASQEELLLMLNLVRPKYFIPVHGEYRMLVTHGRLAQQTGVAGDNVFVAENGDVLEFTKESAEKIGRTYGGNVMVDGSGVGDVGEAVLRDRKHLAGDGIMMVVVTVDAEEARVVAGPDLISRGVYYLPESGELVDELKAKLTAILDDCSVEGIRDIGNVKEHIRSGLSKAVFEKSRRRPIVIPVVMEV